MGVKTIATQRAQNWKVRKRYERGQMTNMVQRFHLARIEARKDNSKLMKMYVLGQFEKCVIRLSEFLS